jgi:hypothetical protein
MSWATAAITKLQAGETVTICPRGNSMTPIIKSGEEVTLVPLGEQLPQKGDVVLVHVAGSDYLHLVKAIQGNRYQIGNNHGRINGWVGINNIYGKKV